MKYARVNTCTDGDQANPAYQELAKKIAARLEYVTLHVTYYASSASCLALDYCPRLVSLSMRANHNTSGKVIAYRNAVIAMDKQGKERDTERGSEMVGRGKRNVCLCLCV